MPTDITMAYRVVLWLGMLPRRRPKALLLQERAATSPLPPTAPVCRSCVPCSRMRTYRAPGQARNRSTPITNRPATSTGPPAPKQASPSTVHGTAVNPTTLITVAACVRATSRSRPATTTTTMVSWHAPTWSSSAIQGCRYLVN